MSCPTGPLLLVANEFLDALPIRQLVRGQRNWSERMVALDRDDRLVFADSPESPALSLLVPDNLRDTAPPGAVFEFCPPALTLAATLGARLEHDPGCGLVHRLRLLSERARGDLARPVPPPAGRRAGIPGERRSERRCRFCRLRAGSPRSRRRRPWAGAAGPFPRHARRRRPARRSAPAGDRRPAAAARKRRRALARPRPNGQFVQGRGPRLAVAAGALRVSNLRKRSDDRSRCTRRERRSSTRLFYPAGRGQPGPVRIAQLRIRLG